MKKGGFLRNVLDTIRANPGGQQQGGTGSSSSSGASGSRGIAEFGGLLKTHHFALNHVARHGFPENPTALAFDPVQKIAAIGTKSGSLRVFGRPGVDVWAQHKPEFAVTHIKFIVNQGAIITVTSDESIHLWSLRGPNLKLQLEIRSPGQQPSQSPTAGPTSSLLTSQQSVVGASQTATSSTTQGINSGAQPGDPDYLADQLSSSPTVDQSKLYSRQPEILHTLKFQREHITCIHQTLSSKWLYIGTERGNVHVANVETFELSGYSIAWNKAIELSRKTHPGAIIHISECPQDTNKLLIGYESGCIALWDLKSRNAEGRYYYTENLLWLAWHYEGKQFVAAHGDGSLVTWQTRSNARPVKVIQPHAKTAPQSTPEPHFNESSQLTASQQPSLASSFARALNNELYRPINKVDWKTSKNNDQFLLFSGGLPYDGLEQEQPQQQRQAPVSSPLQPRQSSSSFSQSINQQQPFLKSPNTPSSLASPSPMSPSISPSSAASRQSSTHQHLKDKKSLRSTSLTVMYGKSITVLEMDETIIDFITVCDNSPYENDTSDPFAVLVLLANDLILIDLTSSGYPSFDSPYPASSLNESPVTCVQYLADCSSDLIPFLYSTSQNVISRAPKKGFSDKEWPINGGEWGQSMQSYPELVITGHADGTIKFWDMSGVNFDLISKIKTSKLFERPNKLTNSIVLAPNLASTSTSNNDTFSIENQEVENYFAIEKIEYYPSTKHLIVAGALSQIIQFKLNKKDTSSTSTTHEVSVIMVEPSPAQSLLSLNGMSVNSNEPNQTQQPPAQPGQHLLLKARSPLNAPSSSSGGSSSSSNSQRPRSSGFQPEVICITPLLTRSYAPDDFGTTTKSQASGLNQTHLCQSPPKVTALAFQADHNILAYSHENGIVLVDIIQKCVIMNASLAELYGIAPSVAGASIMTNNRDINVQPFTSGLPTHYHTSGSSTAATAPGVDFENLRISSSNNNSSLPKDNVAGSTSVHQAKLARSVFGNGESHDNGVAASGITGDNGVSIAQRPLNKSTAINDSISSQNQLASAVSPSGQPKHQSRFTANSMFQRQLSTTALTSGTLQSSSSSSSSSASSSASNSTPAAAARASSAAPGANPARLFQRQLTTSQLFSSPSAAAAQLETAGASNKQRAAALLASARAPPSSALDGLSSAATAGNRPLTSGSRRFNELPGQTAAAGGADDQPPVQQKKPAKNKRIISRMLSISAIHTGGLSLGGGGGGSSLASGPPNASNLSGSHQQLNIGDSGFCTDGGSSIVTTAGDQLPDKIDSSLTRSRSSSASSGAQIDSHQLAAGESILCLCFLDWASAAAAASAAAGSSAAQLQQPSPKSAIAVDGGQQLAHNQVSLWLGTSQGRVLLVALEMPDSEDNRILQLQSVNAEPIPQAAIKLPGAILCLSTFACEPSRSSTSSSSGGPLGGGGGGGHLTSQTSSSLDSEPSAAGAGSSHLRGQESSASSSEAARAALFMAVVSDKQAKVYQVPQLGQSCSSSSSPPHSSGGAKQQSGDHLHHPFSSSPASSQQHHHHHRPSASGSAAAAAAADSPASKLLANRANCVAKIQLSDSSQALRSQVVHMRQPDESCLVSYLATGDIVCHSLPRLLGLMEAEFVPASSARLGQSMCFSRNGHALYQPSPKEIAKFTLSAHYSALINEMTGLLYVAREMPEMPRANFFKSLFSGTSSAASRHASDRDELFGSDSGKATARGVAKHIPSAAGAAGLDKLKGAVAGGMGHEMRMAREGLDERGEKLSEIEDKTLQMMNQSETYAQTAHQLAQKFKDKKWYQF